MKNYSVTPQREGPRNKMYSYVDLGIDQHGIPIHIPCPHRFTFLEVTEENNKLKLIPSENMQGWIIMLSGQISCPQDIAEKIKVVAKGQKEIIGITTPVLLLSTELENFYLRVNRKGEYAYILRFFEWVTTIVTYAEADLCRLKLHKSTPYCNGELIKL